MARLVPAPTPFMLTGPGSSLELARLIADRGARSVLVVTDRVLLELEVVAPLLNALKQAGLAVTVFSEVEPDPTIAMIMAGIEMLRASGATAVLAVGGGSPIDAAKAMIACHASGRPPEDLDGYFKVRDLVLPFFAVPTTAGSGSEVTIASVVSDPGAGRKFAIVDNQLVPVAIALDPNLMVGLPPHVTAATGMDALTHAIESDLSTLATPASRAQSVAAARAIFRDLPRACQDGHDIDARQSLAVASCLAGLAFTRASVGYVHAIAHQLGPLYHLPHGYLNATLLPYVLDFYLDGAAPRMAEFAGACGLGQDGDDPQSLAKSLIAAIRQLNASVAIPQTIEQIVDADIPEIVQRALAEAHGTYPVPTYMSAADCATVVRRAAGARPEKEEV
ncbi:iron-containing alcohol dehydrogenase [Synechococcus sp. Tobar12-5m-g]|uniref:iron-containing alcohol dehydrogenase n=1 Tax=unclassified Synechococcus TaxID=2626047 RepID=UPI0020CF1243|nr:MULTISPECIES: iron-containing alcohol dehydrogenase [unclassified Synechococcus]MCP9771191.1 iron-containing alcohol dehydrogenase [Synechococcus sp. Tobar12-5m-g]MCP9872131.1 iron-containing alcohol dehydrogenase [Synechococcus sp. Cruz CV-v-12]